MPPTDVQAAENWALGFGGTVALTLAGLVALLFWLWSVWRVLRDPSLPDARRIAWLLAVLLLPVAGAIAYWALRPRSTIAGPMQRT